MRPAREVSAGPSPTPIYDALYSEYRRAFRALPGDRTGEEDLGLQGFGAAPVSSRGYGLYTTHQTVGWQPYPRSHAGHHPPALPPAPRRSH
ncbi:hypothetical protein ACIBCM_15745 [Streptomyces sp. NPDC051018]|uniref:hypothetical protein n=1 Tax=Streptomyces sp. NPDC051018 TaxID=3365639 RepID=UPI0037945FA8